MRHITLLRHAKSSWEDTSLKDFDRPLAPRGVGDILIMAKEMNERITPDIIISSRARRTTLTALGVNEILNSALLYDDRLYEASMTDMFQVIGELDDSLQSIMIVGHNPTLHDFIEFITSQRFKKIPTCSATILTTSASSWREISNQNTKLKEFLSPKMFR